eukprot:TRINITY_DN964_c0_g1_i1.p1 TRINITY_DN964_c0_g1~~TRINITY_DN964_c0_g1_i1.p1  ORF type:complete len:182 (-),score=28.16 TRINITY_DN964_c0_g1_i1:364-909(-)
MGAAQSSSNEALVEINPSLQHELFAKAEGRPFQRQTPYKAPTAEFARGYDEAHKSLVQQFQDQWSDREKHLRDSCLQEIKKRDDELKQVKGNMDQIVQDQKQQEAQRVVKDRQRIEDLLKSTEEFAHRPISREPLCKTEKQLHADCLRQNAQDPTKCNSTLAAFQRCARFVLTNPSSRTHS